MMIIMIMMISNLYADLLLIKDCDYDVDSDNEKDTHMNIWSWYEDIAWKCSWVNVQILSWSKLVIW